jgi:hypothetical protein
MKYEIDQINEEKEKKRITHDLFNFLNVFKVMPQGV